MGMYLNPVSETFTDIASDPLYVDKTGIIEFLNSNIGIPGSCRICNSRPRRFGKTFTASMLTYYYCKTFNADPVFSKLEIATEPSYRKHLNKHNVVYIDVQAAGDRAGGYENLVDHLTKSIFSELSCEFPSAMGTGVKLLADALANVRRCTGEKFIFIIDEWDAILRSNQVSKDIRNGYYNFLRSLFKGSDTPYYLDLAYMTGVLPIKRIESESALNDFVEYTIASPSLLAKYAGLTEEEVKELCSTHVIDLDKMKDWYDGYSLGGYHVFNPRSVYLAVKNKTFSNYWSTTGTYKSIVPLIESNFLGLNRALQDILTGIPVYVNPDSFDNDATKIKDKNDVLSYLVHLGYLAYDADSHSACIPNKEIRSVLESAVNGSSMKGLVDKVKASCRILDATLKKDSFTLGREIDVYHSLLYIV